MSQNLSNRLKKAEMSFTETVDARKYIDAMKRHFAGEDNGESFEALPPLETSGVQLSRHDLYVFAMSELEEEARLKGVKFEPKRGPVYEAEKRIKELG